MAAIAGAPGGYGQAQVLDSAPQAPRAPSMASLTGGGQGAGPEAGSPQMMALQGLQLLERGAQMLASTIPDMAPQLAQLVSGLRQAVPQAMSAAAGGGPPMQPPPPM